MTTEIPSTSVEMEVSDFLDEIENPTIIPSNNDEPLNNCPQSLNPEKPLKFNPMDLNFARKFSKQRGGKLSRDDFDELLSLKITEAIVYREKNTKLRSMVDRHVLMIESLQNRLSTTIKQYHDLKLAHDRVMARLQSTFQNGEPLKVLKIIRDVGIQVYQQELVPGVIHTIDLDQEEKDTRNPFNRSPVRSPSPEFVPPKRARNKIRRKIEIENKNKKEKRKRRESPKPFVSLNSTVIEEDEGTSRKKRKSEEVPKVVSKENDENLGPAKSDILENLQEAVKVFSEMQKSPQKSEKGFERQKRLVEAQKLTKNAQNNLEKQSKAEMTQNHDQEAQKSAKNNPDASKLKKKLPDAQNFVNNESKDLNKSLDPQKSVENTQKSPKDSPSTSNHHKELPEAQNFPNNDSIDKNQSNLTISNPHHVPFSSQSQINALNSSSIVLPPFPVTPKQTSSSNAKKIPPHPQIDVQKTEKGIKLTWNIDGMDSNHADILKYEIYTCDVNSNDGWLFVGDIKALLLPMAATMSQLEEGRNLFFAVRGVDVHKRHTEFSDAKSWM